MTSDDPIKDSYAWHFLTRFPPRELRFPRFMDSFRDIIRESANAHPGFVESLRIAALDAIRADEVDLVRQGLQCLAHVGATEDIPALEELGVHPDQQVVIDSQTCIFEIRNGARLHRDS